MAAELIVYSRKITLVNVGNKALSHIMFELAYLFLYIPMYEKVDG